MLVQRKVYKDRHGRYVRFEDRCWSINPLVGITDDMASVALSPVRDRHGNAERLLFYNDPQVRTVIGLGIRRTAGRYGAMP